MLGGARRQELVPDGGAKVAAHDAPLEVEAHPERGVQWSVPVFQ